jgi:hypothetical protein
MSRRRLAIAALLTGSTACVLPRFDASGAELSWFLSEARGPEDERAVRTCTGARVTAVEVVVVDEADEDRRKKLRWTCEQGYRTPAEFFTTVSDAFVPLRPGSYRFHVATLDEPAARGEEGTMLVLSDDVHTVPIGSDDATQIQWDITPGTIAWEIEVRGTATCAQVELRLVHADAEAALAEPPEPDEAPEAPEADDPTYRSDLATDGGLRLGGEPTACADLEDGLHIVREVDRGAYVLELNVDDGPACAIDVELDGRQGVLTLDLGDPPC